ncbi:GNAT family N-acetyltransferase [Pilimelia columellifera]|uniref:N-acetyltransferase domain-containing protein n=1 Tax=Pilimelia columellifera subsp. columellifera TaxID=706583 RepID=A0ABN3N402_9ACTN
MTALGERAQVTVRAYRPTDHQAARRLWAELAEEQERQYPGSPAVGGDAGAGIEEYLARIDLSGVWVAEGPGGDVLGLAGLVLHERGGEVWPVVVTAPARGAGIGAALARQVAEAARGRGMTSLTVSPAARNVAALRCLHAAGFDALAALELVMDLGSGRPDRRDGVRVHDLMLRI